MRKFLFGLLLGGLFYSCASDQYEDVVSVSSVDQKRTGMLKDFGDGEYEVLGRGYDITGSYLHPKSVRYQVLDIKKYKEDHPGRLYKDIVTWGEDVVFSGYSSEDYTKDVSKHKRLGASVNAGSDSTNGTFTGNISEDITNELKISYSSKYSYASIDLIRNHQVISINDKIEGLYNYLTPDFLADLNNYSADYIVERYGTHVITNFTIGGHYRLLYRSVTSKTYSSEMKKKTVESGLGYIAKNIGLNVNSNKTLVTTETLTNANEHAELFVQFFGGTGTGLSFDLEKNKPTKVDLEKWENQIAVGKMSLTEMAWDKTYPIYDFISDPIKKKEIKDAVARYKDKRKLETLEVVLLREWRSNKERNHIFSIDVNFVPGNGNRPDYFLQDDQKCYVHKTWISGSVPLYQWYSSKELNYIYTVDASWYPVNRPDYVRHGTICYVYDKQVPGTVPMYQWYSKKFLDYFYTTQANKNDLGDDWIMQGIVFYVFPHDGYYQ